MTDSPDDRTPPAVPPTAAASDPATGEAQSVDPTPPAPSAPPARYWELPREQPRVTPFRTPDEAPPGALQLVGRGIDLNLALSRDIRGASIYVGLAYLLAFLPVLVGILVASIRSGGLDWLAPADPATSPIPAALNAASSFALLIAFLCAGAISLDGQLIALGIAGGGVAEQPVTLRAAIGIARRRFWRLIGATILVGLILLVPRAALESLVGARTSSEIRLLVTTAIDLILSPPFAYVGAAVVVAGLGPLASIRGSWRIARRRWRLAFVVGVVNTAVTYIGAFALGAGADILIRVATALGLDRGAGLGEAAGLLAIVTLAIVAVGSLTVAVACLSVAPQVIAWVRLGGPMDGLRPVDPLAIGQLGPPDRPRLVSLPMVVAIAIEVVLVLGWLLQTG